jgi:hypothetical protein
MIFCGHLNESINTEILSNSLASEGKTTNILLSQMGNELKTLKTKQRT